MDSPFAPPFPTAHTYHMTRTTQLRTSMLVLMVSAVAFASVAAQALTRFVVQALADSKSVRVAPVSACSTTQDSTHFTGCSSIL